MGRPRDPYLPFWIASDGYLRSRGIVSKRDKVQSKRARRIIPMPEHYKEKVNANPNKYFELWIKKRGHWGEIELEEKRLEQTTKTEEEQHVWLIPRDLEKALPEGVLEEYVEAAMDAPEGTWYRPHRLMPDNLELAKFKVSQSLIEVDKTQLEESSTRTFRGRLNAANGDQETAQAVLGLVQQEAPEPTTVQTSPQEHTGLHILGSEQDKHTLVVHPPRGRCDPAHSAGRV